MGLIARVLRRESFSVSLNKTTTTFLYREGGKRLVVNGEDMADGYAVYASSIRRWESAPAEMIDDTERQRIATNIRRYLISRGLNVYLA